MRLIISTLACPLLVITLLTSCGGGSDSATLTPSATALPSSTAQPSATSSIEAEVGDAYLQYWDAYSAALLALDSTPVAQFASGQQLQRIQDEIDGLHAQGVAERVVVEHHFAVIGATATTATVSDQIVNNSFFVDPVTKDPPSAAGSGERFTDTYKMAKVGDRWVVVNGSRQSSGAS
ncbi:MAG: hypothetical protein M3O21_02860 [Chloroflexota bacterium]|nr:hypothetical protein [Chloroflexota bacterium]